MSADFANLTAYELWAQRYPPLPHNPLMRAEQAAMLKLLPDVSDAVVLDLACGSGRYARLLAERGAQVVASDYSPAMLSQVRDARHALPVRADMLQLPFPDACFDVVVSGLAVGHAPQLQAWLTEAARVLAPGGTLLYSDFHPDAAAAGMTRNFTDAQGHKHSLLHQRHEQAAHQTAALAVGLVPEVQLSLRVGHELTEAFSGSEDFYCRWPDLAVVLVLRMRKP